MSYPPAHVHLLLLMKHAAGIKDVTHKLYSQRWLIHVPLKYTPRVAGKQCQQL